MRHSVIGVWEEASDQFEEYSPRIYTNGAWNIAPLVYVYTENEWQLCGGARTLMIPFITSDNKYFYTSDGKMFLVRAHE